MKGSLSVVQTIVWALAPSLPNNLFSQKIANSGRLSLHKRKGGQCFAGFRCVVPLSWSRRYFESILKTEPLFFIGFYGQVKVEKSGGRQWWSCFFGTEWANCSAHGGGFMEQYGVRDVTKIGSCWNDQGRRKTLNVVSILMASTLLHTGYVLIVSQILYIMLYGIRRSVIRELLLIYL